MIEYSLKEIIFQDIKTMKKDEGFQSLGDIFVKKKKDGKKPPAYQWQELALKIILELSVPPLKKSSIFKVCRDYPKEYVERCLTDTKELCKGGDGCLYFLKVISDGGKKKD